MAFIQKRNEKQGHDENENDPQLISGPEDSAAINLSRRWIFEKGVRRWKLELCLVRKYACFGAAGS